MQIRIYPPLRDEITDWSKKTGLTVAKIANMAAEKGWRETVRLLKQHVKPTSK